jgi:hypothetical protein
LYAGLSDTSTRFCFVNYLLVVRASMKNVSEPKQAHIRHEFRIGNVVYHALDVMYG